ncbi:MAG: DUF1611 domain-containing protein, partial [Planctomycetota bacterium]
PLKSLADLKEAYESMAALMAPSQVIGVAMNGRRLAAEEAEAERRRVGRELCLPVCDVVRDGADALIQPIERMLEARAK